MAVVLTPEAQAILDKNRAKKAKKEPATKATTKKTKAEVDASLATAPKLGESLSVAERMAGIIPTLGQVPAVLDDALRVGLKGTTAGALDWALEKTGLEPGARTTTAEARTRLAHPDSIEAVGAILPALAGPGLATVAAKTPGLLGGAARTGLSALEGAGYGATSAATDLDETTSPGQAAAVGGAFGVGGQLLGEGAGAAWNWLKGLDPRETVARIIAKNPQAADELAALGPEGIVADVGGEPGRTLIRGVSDKSPEARQILLNTTEPRQARQQQNIVASVENAAQIAPEHRLTPAEMIEQLRETRRPGINAAYREAQEAGYSLPHETRTRTIQEPVPPGTSVLEEGATNVTPQQTRSRVVEEETEIPSFFGDLLNTPSGRRAWRKAGVDREDWRATEGDIVDSDLWRLDATKKNLDGLAAEAFRAGNRTKGTKLAQLATAVRTRMDGLLELPEYAAARGAHEGMEGEIAAINRGAELAKPRYDATLTRDAIAAREGPQGHLLGPAQAQGYGHAKAAQLRGNPLLGQDIGSYRSQLSQEGAHAALGDRAEIIEEAVRRADTFTDTHKSISGGSQTSRNLESPLLQAIKDNSLPAIFSSAPVVYGIMTGNKAAMATGAAAIISWAASKGYSALRAKQLADRLPEIARILTSQNIPTPTPFRASPAAIKIGSAAARGGGLLGAQ